MRIQISGKQMDVGAALQTHAKAELTETLEKYARQATDAQVVFTREGHGFVCEASVHLDSGLTAAAKGSASEVYAAFEACRERLDKQFRRYKRRLKDHYAARRQPVATAQAHSYILAADGGEEGEEPETLAPVIIAESQERMPSLSVGEAVMQMELAGAPLLVFRNEKGGGVNVVYRRDDGHIGWIEPTTN